MDLLTKHRTVDNWRFESRADGVYVVGQRRYKNEQVDARIWWMSGGVVGLTPSGGWVNRNLLRLGVPAERNDLTLATAYSR